MSSLMSKDLTSTLIPKREVMKDPIFIGTQRRKYQ